MKKQTVKTICLSLSAIMLSGCSVFGVSNVKEAKYQTVVQEGKFSVREYAPVMMAQVIIKDKDYSDSTNDAFQLLFDYISGANQKQQKIEMTAPVLNHQDNERDAVSQKIAMTAPVFIDQDSKKDWSMSFVMPADFTPENTPKPTNPKVKVFLRPAEKVAVVQFSGTLSQSNRGKYTQLLQDWIKQKGYEVEGKPVYAGYNPPWTIPAFRRNEVQIKISQARHQ